MNSDREYDVADVVRRALREDLAAAGDLTTAATVPAETDGTAYLTARQPGVLAGCAAFEAAFLAIDPAVRVQWHHADADRVETSDTLATVRGAARSLLTAERTALNLLGHLSGIATRTAAMVRLVDGTPARIADTRKTTPGLRALEKAAVVSGGGVNHRFGLYDAILVKDNHIALGGGLTAVLGRLAGRAGHLVRVEVEVDTLDQLDAVLKHDVTRIETGQQPVVHAVLLDNMGAEQVAEGVRRVRAHPAPVTVEVSGGVTEESVRGLALAGADLISCGALTHSVTSLDVALDLHAASPV